MKALLTGMVATIARSRNARSYGHARVQGAQISRLTPADLQFIIGGTTAIAASTDGPKGTWSQSIAS